MESLRVFFDGSRWLMAELRNQWLSLAALAWTGATSAALLLHTRRSGCLPRTLEKSRLKQFNGWQFMICCIIIWHHYCDPSIFSQLAYCSVTFFVFFSGFITHYAYRDKMAGPKASLVSYYVRRMGRVLMVYYSIHFSVLLCKQQPWTTDFQGSVLMFCTFYGSSPQTNFPAWTVCALIWCWLFAPLPSKLLFRARQSYEGESYALVLWLLLVILGTLDETWSHTVPADPNLDFDFWFYETRHNVFIFCLGLCTCEVALYLPAGRGPWNWFWPIWCDATLLLTLLVTAKISSEGLTWGSRYWSGCYAPVALWVLSSTLGHQSLLHPLSSHRLLQLLGDYSMQIYLLSNPLHDFLAEKEPLLLYFFIIAASVAVADLIEKPLSQQLKKWSDRLQPGLREEDGSLLAECA